MVQNREDLRGGAPVHCPMNKGGTWAHPPFGEEATGEICPIHFRGIADLASRKVLTTSAMPKKDNWEKEGYPTKWGDFQQAIPMESRGKITKIGKMFLTPTFVPAPGDVRTRVDLAYRSITIEVDGVEYKGRVKVEADGNQNGNAMDRVFLAKRTDAISEIMREVREKANRMAPHHGNGTSPLSESNEKKSAGTNGSLSQQVAELERENARLRRVHDVIIDYMDELSPSARSLHVTIEKIRRLK